MRRLFQTQRVVWLAWLLLASVAAATAEEPWFSVSPAVSMPLGSSGDLFTFGLGVGLDGRLPVRPSGRLEALARVDYLNMLLQADAGSLHLLRAAGGVGLPILRNDTFSLSLLGMAGGFVGFFEGSSPTANPYASAGARLDVRVGSGVKVGLQPMYDQMITRRDGGIESFYSGAGLQAQVSFQPGARATGTAAAEAAHPGPRLRCALPGRLQVLRRQPGGNGAPPQRGVGHDPQRAGRVQRPQVRRRRQAGARAARDEAQGAARDPDHGPAAQRGSRDHRDRLGAVPDHGPLHDRPEHPHRPANRHPPAPGTQHHLLGRRPQGGRVRDGQGPDDPQAQPQRHGGPPGHRNRWPSTTGSARPWRCSRASRSTASSTSSIPTPRTRSSASSRAPPTTSSSPRRPSTTAPATATTSRSCTPRCSKRWASRPPLSPPPATSSRPLPSA